MGALTLSNFLTEVKSGLGNRTDSGVADQRIVNVLNLAQTRISRAWPWKDLQLTYLAQMSFTGNPAVDKYITPPANLKTLHSFVLLDTSAGQSSLGQSQKLTEKPWRWFDEHYPSPEWITPGWPTVYAYWGRFLVVAPPPFLQFTAQFRGISYPTPFVLADPTQASDYQDKDDILINFALGYLWRSYGRVDLATYHENIVAELVKEAIEFDDRRPDMDVSRDIGTMPSALNVPYWANPFIINPP